MDIESTAQHGSTELPAELTRRIWKESQENDQIYRRRSAEAFELSRLHYGHVNLLDRAFKHLGNVGDARLLDVGVGEGQSSVLMARKGARVTGIEVSKIALERAEKLARQCEVEVDFRLMPGEDLQFEESSFDAILCISAYHHMDQERAVNEFARVLRPGGRLVLVEPLAANPPAWLYRRVGRFLSREATSEERPLRIRDLRFLRQHFRKVEWEGMYFLLVIPFGVDRLWRANRLTSTVFRWLSPIDSVLMKVPGVRRIAWKIVIVAER